MRLLRVSVLLFTLGSAAFAGSPFFAFDNGVGRQEWTPDQQAATLAELGFAGIGYTGFDAMEARRAAFDAHQVRIFNLYVGCHLDQNPVYDPAYKEAIAALKGTDIDLWFTIQGGKRGENDDRALAVLREVADLAQSAGVRVALYPHYGFYVADLDDALRIAEKADRPNVGVTFNLCHELRAGHESRFDELLEKAAPRLFYVSINGADHEGDWDRLIQPLGRGAFDVFPVLQKLKAIGYAGPVGLQCYNVPGDVRANLSESLTAWEAYQVRLRD
jgi:sugar phosphate isomerase/epimerase